MKTVQILLSSYNGQKYIRQQLDSIFDQQGVEIHCLIRDDGSTDETIDILEEYQKKNPNVKVIRGENIGYKKSFMTLLEMSGEYDYYAFADQDDVWKRDKLIKAIEKLEDEENSPLMYCSNCLLVDQDLNNIGKLHNVDNIVPQSKVSALVQGFAHGCTTVINRQSRNLLIKYKPRQEFAHDYWVPIVILFLGKVIYDTNSYILYRQHQNNVFGSKRSIGKVIKNGINKFNNSKFHTHLISELLKGYEDVLNSQDKLVLQELIRYRRSPYTKLKLMFNRELAKNTFKGTLFLKLMILFSRF